ncbi:MAG: alkaline phosphatase family protein [Luteimonas sp.]|nr:alkaline phosphatase family protein [Luteimonas sp.]
MPFRFRFPATLVACLLAAWLTACASTPSARDALPRTVVVLSFDGLPATTIGDGSMPALDALSREGVHAHWLLPSFPTLTFPNHYTLATGLRPDHHGIVGNYLRDATFGDYHSKRNGAEGHWYGGEPIWATLQRQGGRGAALAWVGGQDPADPRAPALMVPFDGERSVERHIDQVLAWLDLPADERPQLVMDYFQHYDVAAHANGPASPEAALAKSALDAGIARLVDGLRMRGLEAQVDLVVVSDHGMDEVPPTHVDWLDPRVPADAYDVIGTTVVGIAPKPGREAEVARLLGRHAHHACHAKGAMPAHWRYGTHPRVPPIVCLPDPGWYLLPREPQRRPPRVRGEHGFDNADPAMRAVFVARGPSFRTGVTLPAFDNVDVYPLLARLLGIEPAPNDGSVVPLLPGLRDARTP